MQSSALAIVENMSDIIGYAHSKVNANGQEERVLTLRSLDNSIRCGCRFKYIAPEIPFSYEALTTALNEAIDKEAAETNGEFVTDERVAPVATKTYDHEALMKEFNSLVSPLMEKDKAFYSPRITQIIEKYLGKGKKVMDATIEQAEFIHLINTEIKEDLID